MTRIIAGFAGSLPLAVPPVGTRPTSDRVREAIFSALDARDVLQGARVVDLYAGSGALGLEAASRGAARVVLVDRNAAVARRNAATIARRGPTSLELVVAGRTVRSFLASALEEWDVAFLDPPYDLEENALEHDLEQLAPRLSPGAVVVAERSTRSAEPRWPQGVRLDRRTAYGDTALWWAERLD